MGKFLEEIPDYLIEWLLQQQMFWVASAPLSPDGHVNISPKAIEGTFHVVNSRRVWYEDLSGTGAETVAHIRENGRVTILFHAFEGPARIVRLYGKGFFYEIGTPEYDALVGPSKRLAGSRAVIGLDIHKVGTTCGYAVPYYQFLSHRTQLMTWAAKREATDHEFAETQTSLIQSHPHPDPSSGTSDEQAPISPNGMKQWWLSHNLLSLDGLPAFSVNLGKGFPFGVVLNPSRNAHASHNAISTHARPSIIATNANTMRFPADAPQNELSAQEDNSKVWSPFQVRKEHLAPSSGHQDIISMVFFILPYLMVLAIGISIGRISNCPRAFSLYVV